MVQFHEHIITELLEDPNGGLVVLSSGLGLHKLISSLLLLHHPSQGTLLLLSSSPSLKSSILSSLRQIQNPNTTGIPNLPSEITSDLPAYHRLSLYSSGAAVFVTTRILVVDLLTSRLSPSSVAGIILLNAHSLSDTSTETLIVRILRSSSSSLYIRAFSDKPHAMVAGFAKPERILKCLYLRKLHLWPRFQVYVSQDLERNPPEVVDVRVAMSPYMRGIQKAVIEVMDACLKEMRKTNKVDVDDLTVENGLFKSFDEIVKRQLDPIWHTLGKKTKQLVSDLKTLRKLLDYLVRYDAVTYLKYLDSLRAAENFRSVWIFAESSYKIFEYAKKRVYHFGRLDGGKLIGKSKIGTTKKRKLDDSTVEKEDSLPTSANSGVVLEEVLEEPPKWKEVLEEIEEEREKRHLSMVEHVIEGEEDDNGIVLVACKDERSCMQLEDCIIKGPHKAMREEWEKYLLSKIELHGLPKHNKKKAKDPKGFGILDGVIPKTPGQKGEASSISKQENDALLAAAAEVSKHNKKDTPFKDHPQPYVGNGGDAKGRGKGRKGKTSGSVPLSVNKDDKSGNEAAMNDKTGEASSISKQENDALLAAAAEVSKHNKKDTPFIDHPQPYVGNGGDAKGRGKGRKGKTSGSVPLSVNKDAKSGNEEAMNDKTEMLASGNGGQGYETDPVVGDLNKVILQKHYHGVDAASSSNAKQLPSVHFYALESDQHILDILKPSSVIVYHPDVAFVREIEIYKAENPMKRLKVYFLFYEDSTEVQKFEASIRRENGAFESLIRQKSLMMIPVDQDGRSLGQSSSIESESIITRNSVTRKAGGRKEDEKEMQVIVDMREFMSSLPNVLHQKGIRIIPVTLEVGDYILSPQICVERKSIQDLFGSFASGRLYNQVETMVRYYRMPVLLIEFSQDKSFSFQSASDIGDDVSLNSIISKLSLLVLHFPRLRIVWSRSLFATAEIFASLKSNQDEPDEAKAMRVGVPSEEGIVENDVRAENYNTSAVEFLRRLPGVSDSNYRAIMDGCESLAELALLPLEKLSELMGGQKAAKTLREFLDAKYPTLL